MGAHYSKRRGCLHPRFLAREKNEGASTPGVRDAPLQKRRPRHYNARLVWFDWEFRMRHVISALVMNEPGVLANVAGMFAARGFNIDSLVVGRTENPELSRMTIVVTADDNTLEQVRKQLAKLVPVVKVRDFKDAAYIERDLALITVGAGPEHRSEVIEIANLFRGKVVDVGKASLMIELAGTEEKIEAFIELMKPYTIKELSRTGVIAMARGTQVAKDEGASATTKPRTRSLDAPAAAALPPSWRMSFRVPISRPACGARAGCTRREEPRSDRPALSDRAPQAGRLNEPVCSQLNRYERLNDRIPRVPVPPPTRIM